MAASGYHAFTAKIERLGSTYVVRVPAKVSRAIGVRGPVPVEGLVARFAPFKSTLMPTGGGRHVMFVNGEMRRLCGAKLGDRVTVALRHDTAPRDVEIPEDLTRALDDAGALEGWPLVPRHKKNVLVKWIEEAAREDTREKRLARAVEEALAAREKQLEREARAEAARIERALRDGARER